jgi:hypothetical protein
MIFDLDIFLFSFLIIHVGYSSPEPLKPPHLLLLRFEENSLSPPA